MVAPWLVLAEASKAGEQAWRHQLLWAGPAIAGLLLLAALVIAWVKRWSKRSSPTLLTAGDQLARFRILYERGELSPEEFSRLRALLTERLKKEVATLDVPPPAAPPPPPPPSSTAMPPRPDGPAGQAPPGPNKSPG
jgi:hypothetical protein